MDNHIYIASQISRSVQDKVSIATLPAKNPENRASLWDWSILKISCRLSVADVDLNYL